MSWRALRRSPAFAISAVLLLAVGIGGATLIFSVTDAVLLRPLRVARPEELVRVVELIPGRPPSAFVEGDAFLDWQARNSVMKSTVGHSEVDVTTDDVDGRPLRAEIVTANYFDVLGVRAAIGHLPAG